MPLQNLSPAEIADALEAKKILLIDVREAGEYAAERIEGAVLAPLSTFNPAALPDAQGRKVVFQCAGGVRSAKAVALCQAAGLPYDAHMAGGIQAWKAAGLPVQR